VHGLAPPRQSARGAFIAYATAPNRVADDGSGRNGVYTKRLLRYMAPPGLSVDQLFKRVCVAVEQETADKQTPWESSSLAGDFYFIQRQASSASVAEAERRLEEEKRRVDAERQRLEDERRRLEEQRRLAEEQRQQEEACKQEEVRVAVGVYPPSSTAWPRRVVHRRRGGVGMQTVRNDRRTVTCITA
jgi:uncharacterized caspase-like protein